jgi:hypothetical protein
MKPGISSQPSSEADWKFTTAISAERAAQLGSWQSFDGIASALMLEAVVGGFWWEPFNSARLKGCNRASFPLRVMAQVYDAFFNSAVGYRAQYAVSPSRGAAANRALLDSLEPALMAAVAEQGPASIHLVRASLHGVDAKVWILEAEVEDQLSEPHASLAYGPWEFESLDGQGLRTPVGTTLEVKGAWLNVSGVEIRDPMKADRNSRIHRTGFA